jgi:Rad3-related DNA helicase
MNVLRPDKSGIIHTTSEAQANELDYFLRYCQDQAGQLQFLTWIPQKGTGTDNQFQEWCKVRQPGTYCISWNFHEGVDLGKDDINIMAKTPWTSLKSNYEKAKLKYDPDWYSEKTGYTMMQLFGRHQRGLLKHYAPGAKMAYIADSSWHRLKPSLPNDFIRRIRNWNGK